MEVIPGGRFCEVIRSWISMLGGMLLRDRMAECQIDEFQEQFLGSGQGTAWRVSGMMPECIAV